MVTTNEPETTLNTAAWYRIEVLGLVPCSWADRLGDLRLNVCVDEGGEESSVLTGEVADQAALIGVLSTLYMLHLPLKLVVCLGTRCFALESDDPCGGQTPALDEMERHRC